MIVPKQCETIAESRRFSPTYFIPPELPIDLAY